MIGQSTVNVMNGARGRISTTSAALFLVVVILVLADAIGLLPVACLTGILFIIVIKTFHWPTFVLLFQLPLTDALAIVMVTVLAVVTNLAIAVGAGIVWRALVHSYASSQLIRIRTEVFPVDFTAAAPGAAAEDPAAEGGLKVYHVDGSLFFGSAMTFRSAFSPASDPPHIIIDFSQALVADFSAVTVIRGVCKRYSEVRKRVTVCGLSAYSQRQVHRNLKLRHFALASAKVEERRGEVGHEPVAHDLQSLLLFRPEGDEIDRPDATFSPGDVGAELRREGLEVADGALPTAHSPDTVHSPAVECDIGARGATGLEPSPLMSTSIV